MNQAGDRWTRRAELIEGALRRCAQTGGVLLLWMFVWLLLTRPLYVPAAQADQRHAGTVPARIVLADEDDYGP